MGSIVIEETDVAVGEEFVGNVLYDARGKALDVVAHLFDGVHFVIYQMGFADGLHFVEGKIVLDGYLGDELLLGGVELQGGERFFLESFELFHHQLDIFLFGFGLDTGVDVKQTCVGEWGVLRLDGVAKAILLSDGDIQSRVHRRSAQHVIDKGEAHFLFVKTVVGAATYQGMNLVCLFVDGGVELMEAGRCTL